MKSAFFLLFLSLLFIGCNKEGNTNEKLSEEDLLAVNNMNTALSLIQPAIHNLIASTEISQRHHWDNLYHQYNNLFWHHHNNYHHNSYTHDDHSHHWVPYDPHINHHNHHHPLYPNHLNDSLVTIPNSHHLNKPFHNQGHDRSHHIKIDSLHRIHQVHHP